MVRIFSWNVNGIRAVLRKGALQKFISEYRPDVLCLQEVKAKPEQVDYDFPGYKVYWNPAERPGYSGTAILVSEASDLKNFNVIRWQAGKDCPAGNFLGCGRNIRQNSSNLDQVQASETNIAVREGRALALDCDIFYLVNVYVPNSKPDLSRLELRHQSWDPGFLAYLKELEKIKPVVVCGDFNAAFSEIDLARPAANHHNAGFTDEEREGISRMLEAGFVDTFRSLNPDARRYTWWSHWGHARENNVGWRIDYFFVSSELANRVTGAEIYEGVLGSDHCPVSIDLDLGSASESSGEQG